MIEQFITPGITMAVWVLCSILKLWIADNDRKVIPTVAAICGACLGLATLGLTIDAFVIGAVSGLASTGADQLVKQYRKDTTVDSNE